MGIIEMLFLASCLKVPKSLFIRALVLYKIQYFISLVMIPALSNEQYIFFDAVNKAMLAVNSPGPETI